MVYVVRPVFELMFEDLDVWPVSLAETLQVLFLFSRYKPVFQLLLEDPDNLTDVGN